MKQFQVPPVYKSPLISRIKEQRKQEDRTKKDFSPTRLVLGPIEIYLARHFGFCYGVENAMEIAFSTVANNPGKNIFLLSEMIHNPQVNTDLSDLGVQFLQDTHGKQLIPFDVLQPGDIVMIPAFGTTLEIEQLLTEKGIRLQPYNTTCPFVEKVWNRSAQIAEKGYSIVVHGKPRHEETRATFSHASRHTPTVVVNDIREAAELAGYITGQKNPENFYREFEGRYSAGFRCPDDLRKIGVVNQTTQLASDTQAIAEYLKQVYINHFHLQPHEVAGHFADTRDTLCYATNDNQTAVTGMLATPADFALVIGGYNSSNSSHLVELCERKLITYFIDGPDRLLGADTIEHRNWQTKELITIKNYLPPARPLKILITSGASCPDAVVEKVIRKLAGFFNCEGILDTLHFS
ncbi:MAG TPA: 4-hydroxy-3-methylbut-2-enyl diphosphate reductase [Sediminibacterium sp.]|nr:4-hydroxy-3-methylbut-2-enyl diphosphate reductase [Sediminibacterium sp.]